MPMYEDDGAPDPGAQENNDASGDESAGLNTSAPGDQQPTPGYMNPPAGNPIQGGAQAAEQFLGSTFGQQGPIPNEGSQEPPDIGGAIMAYLRGDGAAPPDQVARLRAGSPRTGNQDADNVLAVAKAKETSGDDAAFGVIQHDRQKYDAYMAHAQAAATGTPQRPADLRTAAASATRAYSFMPDGVTARFDAGSNGIIATVTPWGKSSSSFQLSPQQFAEFTNITKSGQFDNVYEKGGAAAVLADITKQASSADPEPGSNPRGSSQLTNPRSQRGGQTIGDYARNFGGSEREKDNDENLTAYRNKNETNRGVNMGYDVTALHSPDYAKRFPQAYAKGTSGRDRINPAALPPSDSDSLAVRAERAYPGVGQAEQRARYSEQLSAAEEKNETARLKAQAPTQVAAKRNEGNLAVQKLKGEQSGARSDARIAYLRDEMLRKSQAMQQNHQDGVMREQGRMFGRELAAKPGASEAELAKLGEKYGIKLPMGNTPTPGAAPQQSRASTTVPPQAAAALKKNPQLAPQFDAKYGAGASTTVLGQ